VDVVFCGGCNPQIDRVALAAALNNDPAVAGRDVTVYLSGCARSCASGHELVITAGDAVVVAGECVDAAVVGAADLAATIKRKLEGAADGLED
jgi:hypothetical protein